MKRSNLTPEQIKKQKVRMAVEVMVQIAIEILEKEAEEKSLAVKG